MPPRAILGRPLEAHIRSPGVQSWLEEHWHFPEHVASSVPFAIHVEEVAGAPRRRSGARVNVALHRISLPCVAGDGWWRFGDDTAGVELRLEEAGGIIAVWGASRPGGEATLFPALFLSIAESVRASGLLPLHAAVAVREGSATALAGRSGAGKSTTLWRAVRGGWTPLAEDFAWLDTTTLIVFGWDRGLRLRPDARERFASDVPPERFRREPDGKLFLPYGRLPRPGARTATLARLVVLERREGRPSDLAPLPMRETVRAWWEAVGVPLSLMVRQRVSGEIASLVDRVEAYRLQLGYGPIPL